MVARPPNRTFKVYLDHDRNRFVAVDDNGDLLGVSPNKNNAIGSAVRDAVLASKEGCRVIVMVEKQDGSFGKEFVASPPKA